MNLDALATNLLASLARRYSLPGQILSICQDECWLFILSYDMRTAMPKRSMRLALVGASRARVEVYYPQSASWYPVKEGGALLRSRKDLLDRGATLQLVLALISTWRDFAECGEYEPIAAYANSGEARYYRLDQGVLAERRINSLLPRDLTPAYVIGLKSGKAHNWARYLETQSRDARLHIYDRTALPTFSAGIVSEPNLDVPERLGLGVPLYDAESCLLLAEFFPLAHVPAVFLLRDFASFGRARSHQLVDSLLKGIAQVTSFNRVGGDSETPRNTFLAKVLKKDLETVGGGSEASLDLGQAHGRASVSLQTKTEYLGAARDLGIL